MVTRILSLLSASAMLFAVGCGGFDCPFDRPACCDNVLFGCTIWDLPQGCSCEDYALRSYAGVRLANQTPKQPPVTVSGVLADTSGTWRATGTKTSRNACPSMPMTSTSTLLIREQNRKVNVKILGYGTLNGSRTGDVIRAQGAFKVPGLGCEAFMRSEMVPASAVSSPMTVDISWVCRNPRQSCNVTLKGTARRLG